MADRVYPAKPPAATTAPTTAAPAFPAAKSQLYGANRAAYRPPPNRKFRRSRRSCCCCLCFWITLIILSLILLAGIAGTAVYIIYRPHRPSFTISGLKISTLNVTSSSHLVSNIAANITARNPNKKIVFIYNPIDISVFSDGGVNLGSGKVPAFVHGTKNTTVLKASIATAGGGGQQLEEAAAGKLRSELKSKKGVPLRIVVDTKVKVKMGALKTPKVAIRVACTGIKASAPTGKSPASGSVSAADCKVDLRVKIWKWTF
ncbi:NDR1/HIN1-like protein 13 [Linum perenne]